MLNVTSNVDGIEVSLTGPGDGCTGREDLCVASPGSSGRFRYLVAQLREPAADLPHGHPRAEMLIDGDSWHMPTRSADPFLHATLKALAAQLQLTQPGDSTLERALRVRLRDALAQGRADAPRMAVLLGVSERTLQRRLTELGRSFSDVVEDFRREEAARLLATPGLHLVEVAGRLGYAEQTSFTRAFRRWTGTTPGAWRAGRHA
jgi:AraC-like DNA-binding protein